MSEFPQLFRALSDPNRLAIYQLIRERDHASVAELERSISALAREFELSLSTVSHHVKELRQAGLVRCVKRGQTVFCEADPAALEAIAGFIGGEGSRRIRAGAGQTSRRRSDRAAGSGRAAATRRR